ncbi:MAG: HigA family addiction module antitoxin [Stellaceae bacterium]
MPRPVLKICRSQARIDSKSCAAIFETTTRSASMTNGEWSSNGMIAPPTMFASSTIIERLQWRNGNLHRSPPGEILKQEFLAEYGLTQQGLAKAIGISPNRIAEIVHNRRRITADPALRLGLYFDNSPKFWINLQSHYDLKIARRHLKPAIAHRIRSRGAI